MARRSDNTRKELHEMAITAGLQLLDEGGIEALSARQIAARIGYTAGTLYNVFTDFEDIILHLNAAILADMRSQLEPLALAEKEPLMRILSFAQWYGEYAMAHPARWNLLHNSARTTPLPPWFHQQIHEVFALVEAPLLELCASRPTAARDAAKILWAGLHGICSLSLSRKLEAVNAAPLNSLTTNFVQHYITGLVGDTNAR